MNPFLLLAPAAVVLAVGSWVSYLTEFKKTAWFPWTMVGLYVANGWLWAVAARLCGADDRRLFSVSVCWDVLTLASYNILPLLVCGVRLSPQALVGVGLVVAGAALVKWG